MTRPRAAGRCERGVVLKPGSPGLRMYTNGARHRGVSEACRPVKCLACLSGQPRGAKDDAVDRRFIDLEHLERKHPGCEYA